MITNEEWKALYIKERLSSRWRWKRGGTLGLGFLCYPGPLKTLEDPALSKLKSTWKLLPTFVQRFYKHYIFDGLYCHLTPKCAWSFFQMSKRYIWIDFDDLEKRNSNIKSYTNRFTYIEAITTTFNMIFIICGLVVIFCMRKKNSKNKRMCKHQISSKFTFVVEILGKKLQRKKVTRGTWLKHLLNLVYIFGTRNIIFSKARI